MFDVDIFDISQTASDLSKQQLIVQAGDRGLWRALCMQDVTRASDRVWRIASEGKIMSPRTTSALTLAIVGVAALHETQAAPVTINFDEFTSPPVTCCYSTSGVKGMIVYPTVTVDGGPGAAVMNGSGWGNLQTSGNNLYGATDTAIDLDFHQPISDLALDVINGSFPIFFELVEYNSSGQVDATTLDLNAFGEPGSVGRMSLPDAGVTKATIFGNDDFAIDTITFDTSSVAEPGTLALFGFGLASLGLLRRRKLS